MRSTVSWKTRFAARTECQINWRERRGVECDWHTELIPASEDADEFAAVAKDEDKFLCDCVRHILLSLPLFLLMGRF